MGKRNEILAHLHPLSELTSVHFVLHFGQAVQRCSARINSNAIITVRHINASLAQNLLRRAATLFSRA